MTDSQLDVLLDVRDLAVEFPTREGLVRAVRGVDFSVRPGETLAIVGESGSGKSVTARSLARLVRSPGRITSGSIRYRNREVLQLSERELRAYRGGELGMVFQDPLSSLNPLMTIGDQIAEAVRAHGGHSARSARRRAAELLDLVEVPDPARRLGDYPHQFSGGMRQRVMIAIALAGDPSLIVADEPTTALDVTVQAQILDVFARLNEELGTAVLVITHNLGLVSRLCERALVMYAGRIVEQAPVAELHANPHHPYTWSLLRSVPRIAPKGNGAQPLHTIEGRPPDLRHPLPGCAFAPRCPFAEDRCRTEPHPPPTRHSAGHLASCWITADGDPLPSRTGDDSLAHAHHHPVDLSKPGEKEDIPDTPDILRLTALHKSYPVGRHGLLARKGPALHALRGVNLRLAPGETLGLVGESGCGKSTLTRVILGLEPPDSGTIHIKGVGADPRRLRRTAQLVFQDPYASLNPRHTIGQVIAEPLRIHRLARPAEIPGRVAELLDLVGLDAAMASRLPRDFSGGQRQRIALARALAVRPSLLVLDEPVSALDVSLQAQIVNLLRDLQSRLGISYLFVAHDIAVVRHMSDRIAVMYLGEVVEEGPADDLCTRPLHPYTAALLSAVPEPDPVAEHKRQRTPVRGEVPSPLSPPSGCPFHTRCPLARDRCRTEPPPLRELAPGRVSACHYAEELG
ncbi:dipeptide ABC transporter ATP-binding protein [Streptomyces sp. 6N223]|uniref:dipeptide ABC transporter ATP-binding protein n=1 Tax=Streptomyces sp. 6N223 TaxID=3457412 RepID=UPI003FD164F0